MIEDEKINPIILKGLVKKPSSVGRYQAESLEVFDRQDLAAVESFGYRV